MLARLFARARPPVHLIHIAHMLTVYKLIADPEIFTQNGKIIDMSVAHTVCGWADPKRNILSDGFKENWEREK